MIKQIYLLFSIFILYSVGLSSAWAAPMARGSSSAMIVGSEREWVVTGSSAPHFSSSVLWCQTEVDGEEVYVRYSHPADNDCLKGDERNRIKEKTVLHWLNCVECTPAHLDNVVRWGNEALGLLQKASKGDKELLGTGGAYEKALGNEIDALKPYFTGPVDKDDLVTLEMKRKKRVAKQRAAYALKVIRTKAVYASEAIRTREARNVR